MAAFYFQLCQDLALLYVTIFRKYVTLLYVLMYIIGNKLHNLMCFCDTLCDIIKILRHIICNKVTKINFKVLHFVLLIVVYLLKQNTNDTFNQLPEVPIREIWHYLTARREQYTKPV